MTREDFFELLRRVKAERLLSSEADRLFGAARGIRYSLDLNFIQFSSAFGKQIHSAYDGGYKFECSTDEGFEVVVLFREQHKALVDSLQGQNSREIDVEVLGYDILYQKPILGYFEKELPPQNLVPNPAPDPKSVENRDEKSENAEKKQLPSISEPAEEENVDFAAPVDPARTREEVGVGADTRVVEGNTISIKPPIIVSALAEKMGLQPFEIVTDLIELEVFVAPNQAIEPEIAEKVCEHHGFIFERERREKEGGIQKLATGIEEPVSDPHPANLSTLEPHHWTKGSNEIGKQSQLHEASEALRPLLKGLKQATDLPPQPKSHWLSTTVVVVSILTILIAGPIFLSSNGAESPRSSIRTQRSEGVVSAKEVTTNLFNVNFRKAERSFERGQFATARLHALKGLSFINRSYSGLGGNNLKKFNYHLHNLLGRIYDRVGDSYESCRSFSKAKKYWYDQWSVKVDPNSSLARNLENSIDKQLLKLKDQGMGGLINESNKSLKPISKKWVDSVIQTATDDSRLKVGPNFLTRVLIETNEPYSGWVKSFHESGSIKEIVHLDRGRRHGHYRSWKIDGLIASYATYAQGKKTGLSTTFGKNQRDKSSLYKDGKLLDP